MRSAAADCARPRPLLPTHLHSIAVDSVPGFWGTIPDSVKALPGYIANPSHLCAQPLTTHLLRGRESKHTPLASPPGSPRTNTSGHHYSILLRSMFGDLSPAPPSLLRSALPAASFATAVRPVGMLAAAAATSALVAMAAVRARARRGEGAQIAMLP
jgi:hypothetical protein